MNHHADKLVSQALLEPIWKDIDDLETRGYYKQAYQYLRTVTDELNLLREARSGICCLLERNTEAGSNFQALQSLIAQRLEPIREHCKLMYLESIRSIMQTTHQALLCKTSFSELQRLVIKLCTMHCNQLAGDTELSEWLWTTQSQASVSASKLH